MDDVDMKVIV